MADGSKNIRPGAARIRSALTNAADVTPVMEHHQLVKGWLSEGALSVLYGPPNAGKTFVALSMAAHVAAGKSWCGCRVRQAPVLYLALEGGLGFQNRIAAIKLALPELSETRGLTYITTSLELYDETGIQDLCAALPDKDWGLIVVDTLARAMAGADENAARDMGHFVANLDYLRDVTGAHVMVVHHSGKDQSAGARGSSALRAAVDTELALSADGKLQASKQRDMRAAEPLHFDLSDVYFGTDAEGEDVTSAVAVQSKAPSKRPKPLSGQAEVALQAFKDALRLKGEKKVGPDFPRNRRFVHVNYWREHCERKGLTDPDATPAAKQKAFQRAREKLIESNHVRIQDGYAWRVTEDE